MMDLEVQTPSGHRSQLNVSRLGVTLYLHDCRGNVGRSDSCPQRLGESAQVACSYCGEVAAVTVAEVAEHAGG